MAVSCYHCNSTDTKTLSAVAEQLNINTSSTTVGGFFGGGGGFGAAKTFGNMSPEVVKKIEKEVPHRSGFFNLIKWLGIILVFLLCSTSFPDYAVFWEFWAALAVLTVIGKIIGMFRYPKKYRYYKSLWYCFSCGSIVHDIRNKD